MFNCICGGQWGNRSLGIQRRSPGSNRTLQDFEGSTGFQANVSNPSKSTANFVTDSTQNPFRDTSDAIGLEMI
jgi:hypothetical protein